MDQQPPAPAAIAGSQANTNPQTGQCRQISSILDFSPSWDTVLGGTKVGTPILAQHLTSSATRLPFVHRSCTSNNNIPRTVAQHNKVVLPLSAIPQVLICVAPPLQEDLLQQPLFLAVPSSTHSRALAEPLNSTVPQYTKSTHPTCPP